MNPTSEGKKQDAITLRIERGAQWAVLHWQQVGVAFLALLAAVALAVYIVYNLKKLRYMAWEQLSVAQSMATQGKRSEALAAVNRLLETSRTGKLVSQAQLLKGDIFILEGKNTDALAAYQESERQAPTPQLKALASIGAALALEQSQKWPDAENRYKQFIKDNIEHFLTPRAYESLGRLQMVQEKWTDAESTLERLVTLYPTTIWAKTAQELLGIVKANLAATRPPPAK